jgi:hypothetical protein
MTITSGYRILDLIRFVELDHPPHSQGPRSRVWSIGAGDLEPKGSDLLMQRLISSTLCAFVASVMGAVGAANVYATSALPEFSHATAATGTTGLIKLTTGGGAAINCSKGAIKLGAGTKLGTFAIDAKECKSLSKPCLGLAQEPELIESTGEWHLVSLKTERKSYEIWFLLASTDGATAVHIECLIPVGTLLLIWGNWLGLIEEKSERTFKINIETEGSGVTLKQKFTEFGNNSGEAVTASLKEPLRLEGSSPLTVSVQEALLLTGTATRILET